LVKENLLLMKRASAIAAFVLVLAARVPSAEAERTMSCQDFRQALWRAIDDDGNTIARPTLDKRAGGFGPTIRYEMTEMVGLEGQLICWKDQIFNFSASTRLSGKPTEDGSRVPQLKALAAAAICALSMPGLKPQECTAQAEALVRMAIDDYAKPRAQGEVRHYGAAGARLNDGARIEVEADENSLAFFLYAF
jgi:hypothetical protein